MEMLFSPHEVEQVPALHEGIYNPSQVLTGWISVQEGKGLHQVLVDGHLSTNAGFTNELCMRDCQARATL